MKKFLRNVLTLFILSPYVIELFYLSWTKGREEAIGTIGPRLTAMAKWSLRYFIPRITEASKFDHFAQGMRAKQWLWKPLYDYEVIEVDPDTVRLHVFNCPLCEVVDILLFPELKPYLCQGDWEYAKKFKDKWRFERQHQIGTGDPYCDHTYQRITASVSISGDR